MLNDTNTGIGYQVNTALIIHRYHEPIPLYCIRQYIAWCWRPWSEGGLYFLVISDRRTAVWIRTQMPSYMDLDLQSIIIEAI